MLVNMECGVTNAFTFQPSCTAFSLSYRDKSAGVTGPSDARPVSESHLANAQRCVR